MRRGGANACVACDLDFDSLLVEERRGEERRGEERVYSVVGSICGQPSSSSI
jgi:hypothetical protein